MKLLMPLALPLLGLLAACGGEETAETGGLRLSPTTAIVLNEETFAAYLTEEGRDIQGCFSSETSLPLIQACAYSAMKREMDGINSWISEYQRSPALAPLLRDRLAERHVEYREHLAGLAEKAREEAAASTGRIVVTSAAGQP